MIRVSTVEALFAAVATVAPGGTVLIADGHYWLPRCLRLRTDGLTLRGASGDRTRVILDGARSQDGELVALHACSGVTLADLTVQNVRHNGIKLNSDSNVQRVTIYNCVLHNIWQRAVKGVKVPLDQLEVRRPQDGRIQYCLFYNDRPKRFSDDPADTPANFDGNYVGGIDVMYARGWVIADNVFLGIQGRTREARGAVFLWHETEDCVVERNVIIDCDTGIALGNSHKPAEVPVHATRCVVRNNYITRAPENGIVADYTRDSQIVDNTLHDPANRLGRLIRLVHDNEGLVVADNVLSGPPLRNESPSRVTFRRNRTGDWTRHFVDPASGDLRLKAPLPEPAGATSSRTATDGADDATASPARGVGFKVSRQWEYSAPLIAPELRDREPSRAQKDPSVVYHAGRWHVFMTVKLPGRSAIEYASFTRWEEAQASPRTLLEVSDSDYFCAPQVFYFRPHHQWYLVYQMGVPGRDKMWVAYSTTTNLANPHSWTRAQPMLDGGPDDPRQVGGLDYWIICDDQRAYLFLTSLDGRMWRLWTRLEDFPRGFNHWALALEARVFEASHTYRLKGLDRYLTLIEENGRRYYKAYLADRLDGVWVPLADTAEQPFAGWRNIRPAAGVEPWTDNVSHGELIRDGCDETLTVDPGDLRFVFQGMWEKDKSGTTYGQFQWRIGLLTPVPPAAAEGQAESTAAR